MQAVKALWSEISDETLAAIVERARHLGIPAWRVLVAIGLKPPVEDPQRATPGSRPS